MNNLAAVLIAAVFATTLNAGLNAAAPIDGDANAAARKPNILLIYADDIGYEALNCYGGLDFETPSLNRMAEQGLRFSRAYASPVCTPSRVSLHTGLYVNRHGHVNVLPVHEGTEKAVDFQKMPTFAQQIRARGYRTSVTGKWQLATLQKHPGHIRNAGFDSWCVWQIWKDGEKTDRHWNPTFNQDGVIREDIAGRFGPDVLCDYVIAQMRAAKAAGEPFLIVHNELLPHWPVVETPDDRRLNRKASLANFIHYMDKLVGRLLGEVESLGLRDNTYVFFMGDNGTWEEDFANPRAGQPGERPHTRHTAAGRVDGGKNQLNDGGSHVPLLVWGPPSVPVGAVCDDLVDVVDLFPTFCELTGTTIPAPLAIDGRSLAAQVHGKPGIARPWVHHALYKKLGGENLFDGRFRLFRDGGKMIDARALPVENPADLKDPETAAAKARLEGVFDSIQPDGPRPPESFPVVHYYRPVARGKPRTIECEVAVYGGTPGGVTAAIQAARMGRKTILLSFNRHVGGLTSGGLTATDIGNKEAKGGLAMEFYGRLGRTTGFSPAEAEKTFRAMLDEAGVTVLPDRPLESVRMADGRVRSISLLTGETVAAAIFVDASYEGDLLAAAGVSYRVGREPRSAYGESLAGYGQAESWQNVYQFCRLPISPYVEPGRPASGLLPEISPEPPGQSGQGDYKVQAYNFRMQITGKPGRIPFPRPAGYDAGRYALLARFLNFSPDVKWTLNYTVTPMTDGPVQLREGDCNNAGSFSTDYVGGCHRWPDGTYQPGSFDELPPPRRGLPVPLKELYELRERIFQDHVNYQMGLMYFLANDPAVPGELQARVNRFGLKPDEFQETGHWPHQLYVREARRMVSDYVVTQDDCLSRRVVGDSVGLASYPMDSHFCHRAVVEENGKTTVRNDGGFGHPCPKPYPISYRAIVPKRGECANLLAPVCLSASHAAYGSIRMEPDFMILGQSAGAAASLAVDGKVSVQDVDYGKLKERLLAAGQRLSIGDKIPGLERE